MYWINSNHFLWTAMDKRTGRNSSVSSATRRWAGWWRNRVYVLGSGLGAKLTIHPRLLSRLRISGALPPYRHMFSCDICYDMIYLLTAVGLAPVGSCTIRIYTQTVHRTTQNKQYIEQHKNFENNTKIVEKCGPCPDLASYTLAFALQLRKKHGKTSLRVVEQWEYINLTIKLHKLQY
jgi:hypothetical protein